MLAALPDFQEVRIEKDRFDNIHDDITPQDVVSTFSDFNENFVANFKATGLPEELLVEFVHAVEHLDNLMEMFNYPTERLVTTPDIINFGKEAVDALGYPHSIRPGVSVNQEILSNIQDFFDNKYVKTIHQILSAFNMKGIMFVLDNLETYVGITYNTNHPRFAILTYRVHDAEDGNPGTHIPFLINRLC